MNEQQRSVPYGYCHCGCGQETTIAKRNRYDAGVVQGEPMRFVSGHNSWRDVPEYSEEDRGFETPCWVWLLEKRRGGYGFRRVGGINRVAHRMYYERFVGTIPEGWHVHHRCHQADCVNPAHLNAVDPNVHMRTHAREDRGRLTIAQVREIKRRVTDAYGSCAALAREFGVDPHTINDIKLGKTWTEV